MAMLPGGRADINVTPMIDILLVLMIIFMVIHPPDSHGFDAAVPQPADKAVPNNEPNRDLVISVHANQVVDLNQESTSVADLPARLLSVFQRSIPRVVFIRGDHDLAYREVAEVIDIVRAAGAQRIALMPGEKEPMAKAALSN